MHLSLCIFRVCLILSFLFNSLSFSMSRVIYIVCMSNTCRSPMTEYLLRYKIDKIPTLSGLFEIRSRALTDAYEKPGSPASPQGVEVLSSYFGIDMSGHRSALLTQRDVEEAEIIVPVKRDLGVYIGRTFPGATEKIVNLKKDVQDPWHQPISVYRECALNINELLDDVVSLFNTTDL